RVRALRLLEEERSLVELEAVERLHPFDERRLRGGGPGVGEADGPEAAGSRRAGRSRGRGQRAEQRGRSEERWGASRLRGLPGEVEHRVANSSASGPRRNVRTRGGGAGAAPAHGADELPARRPLRLEGRRGLNFRGEEKDPTTDIMTGGESKSK